MTRRATSGASDAFETLARLGANPTSGVYLRPGCSETTIRRMQAAARRDLGEEVPVAFPRLLRITNGLQINGAYFKEAEKLVPENLDVSHDEVVVLGDEGNMAWYVFDKQDRRFHTVNLGFPNERFASFASFEEMLLEVLREQKVL